MQNSYTNDITVSWIDYTAEQADTYKQINPIFLLKFKLKLKISVERSNCGNNELSLNLHDLIPFAMLWQSETGLNFVPPDTNFSLTSLVKNEEATQNKWIVKEDIRTLPDTHPAGQTSSEVVL